MSVDGDIFVTKNFDKPGIPSPGSPTNLLMPRTTNDTPFQILYVNLLSP